MKINQLFIKHVDNDLVLRLLKCYGLSGLDDKKEFCKFDILSNNTIEKVSTMIDDLSKYYLPCKAKVYLTNLNERRVLTILKQVIRLEGYYLKAKEKTLNNKKVMFYKLISEHEKIQIKHLNYINSKCTITFD